jgi:hypothetical protein
VGLGLASALAGASVLETLTINLYFHQIFRICLHLKVGGRVGTCSLGSLTLLLCQLCAGSCAVSLQLLVPAQAQLPVDWLYCVQVALVDMLYRKSLRLSSAAKGEAGAGKIVNLQVCRCACMQHACAAVHAVRQLQAMLCRGLLVARQWAVSSGLPIPCPGPCCRVTMLPSSGASHSTFTSSGAAHSR